VKGSFWAAAESGKPQAGDVRKRKKTLPVVWALEHASDADRSRLREIYHHPAAVAVNGVAAMAAAPAPLDDDLVAEVLAILERSGAREHARVEARRYRDRALEQLFALPCPDERKEELATVVRSVIVA
jgi:geranylgeranyl diphosphate synthase type I